MPSIEKEPWHLSPEQSVAWRLVVGTLRPINPDRYPNDQDLLNAHVFNLSTTVIS